MEIHPIARIHSDFPGKFGIPRQSGLVPELRSRIIFEPEYRNRDAIRGLEDFSHLWLGIFRNNTWGMVTYRSSAQTWRQ